MTERPEGSGKWMLRAYVGRDLKGRPIQKYKTFHGTKRAASSALTQFVAECGQEAKAAKTGNETVGAYLDRWLTYVTPLRQPTTIRGYETIVKRLKDKLGEIKLSRLAARHLDEAFREWLAEGLSPQTVKHNHRVMATALE